MLEETATESIVSKEFLQDLDEAYHMLETKCRETLSALRQHSFASASGFYNGHYHRDKNGTWQRETYPIPVISVQGLCDVEISFTGISVSTKLRRQQALLYSFEKLTAYRFEAYGVEDYLTDYYRDGQSVEILKENLARSGEEEIGFTFLFPPKAEEKTVVSLIRFLLDERFYY